MFSQSFFFFLPSILTLSSALTTPSSASTNTTTVGIDTSSLSLLTQSFPSNSTAYSLSIPTPSLSLDIRLSLRIAPRLNVGPGPFGQRNWVPIVGGSWFATWGNGSIYPGGQDSQLVTSDLSTYLSALFVLQTSDVPPAAIQVRTTGWRTGPAAVLQQLANNSLADSVDPRNYKFRLDVSFETGDARYNTLLDTGLWVGSAVKRGAEILIDGYRVG